jgi:hypothetical protein
MTLRHLYMCGPQISTRNGRGFLPLLRKILDTPGLPHHGLDVQDNRLLLRKLDVTHNGKETCLQILFLIMTTLRL